MHRLLNMNKSQNLSITFLRHFTGLNDRSPCPLKYFNKWNLYPSIYLKPKKLPLSGGAFPYRPLQGVPPTPGFQHSSLSRIAGMTYYKRRHNRCTILSLCSVVHTLWRSKLIRRYYWSVTSKWWECYWKLFTAPSSPQKHIRQRSLTSEFLTIPIY